MIDLYIMRWFWRSWFFTCFALAIWTLIFPPGPSKLFAIIDLACAGICFPMHAMNEDTIKSRLAREARRKFNA